MQRILKVLVVTALMVMVIAATVAPAFAGPNTRETPGNPNGTAQGEGFGSDYGCIQHGGNHINCGWHAGQTK